MNNKFFKKQFLGVDRRVHVVISQGRVWVIILVFFFPQLDSRLLQVFAVPRARVRDPIVVISRRKQR
jgi:hypothetical protein